MVSRSKKNLQIKEYCFKQTENSFSPVGMENLFKNTFLLDEKTACQEYEKNFKKIVADSSYKSFKQASL